MHTTPTDNELTPPPTITISLSYYLTLACRGFEGTAIVSKEFGDYVKTTVDPGESLTHIEPLPDNPNLVKLYPIQEWRNSLHRRAKLEAASEAERQQRFKREELEQLKKQQIQRRRDMLAEITQDVLKMFPVRNAGMDDAFMEYMTFRALNGENADIAKKFGITPEQITEFKSLPGDPLWKNKYYMGSGK